MKFKYQAKTKEGGEQIGIVEAANREAAVGILSAHELFILSLEEVERAHWYDRIASYFGGVKRKDMVVLTRQLATLLEAQLPLAESLRTLQTETTHPVIRETLLQLSEDISSGLSLSQSMERQGAVFSDFYVSMVRAAEATGKLDEVMTFLADYTEREAELVSKAISSLIYPAILIGLFLVVAFIMVAFVFPQIAPVFVQSGVSLPLLSQVLITSGGFLGTWWPVLLLVGAVLLIVALDYLQTPEGKAVFDDAKIRFPLVSRVYLPLMVTRFSDSMSLLLRGGIPMAQALEIVSRVMDNVPYRELFHEVAESVRQGESLSRAMGKYPDYFPPLISQMLFVGETTGRVGQMFSRIATFYNREADTMIRNIVDLIQPVLMIAIGLLIGLLFASILLPLYQLTATIR